MTADLRPLPPRSATSPAAAAGTRPRRGRFSVGRTAAYALLLLFLLIVLIPVYVLLVTSFKGTGRRLPRRAWNLPTLWTTGQLAAAWDGAVAVDLAHRSRWSSRPP